MMMYGMKVFAAVAVVGAGGVQVGSQQLRNRFRALAKDKEELQSLLKENIGIPRTPSDIYFASFNCGGLEKMSWRNTEPTERFKSRRVRIFIIFGIRVAFGADASV